MDRDELQATADAYLRKAVALGRFNCTQIVEDTVEYLDGCAGPGELRALAWRLVGPRFAEHLAAQAGWPERTDSDRLTDAFRELDAAGIVAREDFACCQNCGVGEIGGEVLPDLPARGYVFHHYQDADRAALGGELWLAWGRFEAPPDAELGAEIAAAQRYDETVEIVRRMPTRTGLWLSAITPSGRIVQMSWDDGRLWLETPHPHDATSTGKHTTVDEAARILQILAEEDRVAIADLPGAVRRPW